jgi:hypothetical protein
LPQARDSVRSQSGFRLTPPKDDDAIILLNDLRFFCRKAASFNRHLSFTTWVSKPATDYTVDCPRWQVLAQVDCCSMAFLDPSAFLGTNQEASIARD